MKKMNTRILRQFKRNTKNRSLQMLTCYDFQMAQTLNESNIDLILVGDSVGNVILGYETTVEVSLDEMIVFASAVKRGATNKFVIADLPFGTYSTIEQGIMNATKLFQKSKIEAVKLEGAFPTQLKLVERLTQMGIPVMGHVGLTPQSVHQQGGYYIHGKNKNTGDQLKESAYLLQKAGAFSVVLECVEPTISNTITKTLTVPTIGIGSGNGVDGQVLVTNDLLKMGKAFPPKFCTPICDTYKQRSELIAQYLKDQLARDKIQLPETADFENDLQTGIYNGKNENPCYN